jgi:hypothetical protein
MKKILLALTATLLWTTGLTCTCDFEGNFLKMSKHVDLIAVVEMTDYSDFVSVDEEMPTVKKPETITFNVLKIIKGSETRKEIRVYGDDGKLCRPGIQDFKKGKYYVIGLHKCQNYKRTSGTLETADYYSVSICGAYWIDYSPTDKIVKGVIDKKRKVTTMTLDKLQLLLKSY